MGIPHLITFLQPFAASESLAGQHIIIDGPAFAHHVYYICLGSSNGARNAFEAAPSYHGLVKAAIDWLEALQSSNVTVDKIYFDGFLPALKMDTRLSRLARSTMMLAQHHTKYPVPGRATFQGAAGGETVLFGNSAMRSCLGTLPPLPFLVPAVLDALANSNAYCDLVEVVPGEADAYCAHYVKEHGGVILTGDSDLLVHEIGPNGAVSFFKDIQLDAERRLSSHIYHPEAIANRLELPQPHGLQFLAFEMRMDPHATFVKLIAEAKSKKSSFSFPELFKAFITEYKGLQKKSLVKSRVFGEVPQILRKMDPRISEYVLQFHPLAVLSGQEVPNDTSADIQIFLPFISDCPTRTNAWEISSTTRQLAYSMINLIVPKRDQKSTVYEHRKQYDKSKGLQLHLPATSNLPQMCESLLQLINQIKEKLPSLSPKDYWITIAIYQEREWANSHSKPSLSETILRQPTTSTKSPTEDLTWDLIHFLGQIHGVYYSLRILHQISTLVLAHGYHDNHTPNGVSLLHKSLEDLPSIDKLSGYADVFLLVERIRNWGVLEICREMLGGDDSLDLEKRAPAPDVREINTKKWKRKRVRKDYKASTDAGAGMSTKQPKKSNNPFALLDEE